MVTELPSSIAEALAARALQDGKTHNHGQRVVTIVHQEACSGFDTRELDAGAAEAEADVEIEIVLVVFWTCRRSVSGKILPTRAL